MEAIETEGYGMLTSPPTDVPIERSRIIPTIDRWMDIYRQLIAVPGLFWRQTGLGAGLVVGSSGRHSRRSGGEGDVTAEKGTGRDMSTVVSGVALLQKKKRARTGRGARVDDRRRADDSMAGSLNVCHRQRGRVLRGQWLAEEGGRYHVLAATTWSGRREVDGE